jgi:hypothetical protein
VRPPVVRAVDLASSIWLLPAACALIFPEASLPLKVREAEASDQVRETEVSDWVKSAEVSDRVKSAENRMKWIADR